MITMVSDFYSARQWHSAGMYCDFFRLLGREHQLILALPEGPGRTARPGRTVRLVFNRGPGPDFSGRDRALLALLRPHLHQAYLDAERRRRPVPRLTPRHWELLRLVAAGYTNTQIARRLGVSEGTVRTHLQNIYERLQVSSRTAAVTRAFPAVCPATSRPSPHRQPLPQCTAASWQARSPQRGGPAAGRMTQRRQPPTSCRISGSGPPIPRSWTSPGCAQLGGSVRVARPSTGHGV